jgi:uncharacterized protein (DUF952 family)
MKSLLTLFLLLTTLCWGEESRPTCLYKIVSAEDWQESGETLKLAEADRDFIHFSTENQVCRILDKYWAGRTDVVILKINPEALPGKLVYETNPGGSAKYYHLYDGSIPLTAVVAQTNTGDLKCKN